MPNPPSVFISYSHDTEEHVDAVLSLSDKLRSEGIDASIDQYQESPTEGWLTWMQRQIESAQYVLVVCTETYKTRLDKNEEPGTGLGAVWEGQLIAIDLYRLQGQNSKYIPVILNDPDQAFIPSILGSVTRYTLANDDGYRKLYGRLTGQPTAEKPPLGALQRLPPRTRLSYSVAGTTAQIPSVEIVGPANFSYSHPSPAINEVKHENYLRTISKTLNAPKRIDVVAVEGAEGIGKTTLLAQFSRWKEESCVSVFLELDDRQTFDPDAIKLNITRQAHWILHKSEFDRSNVDQATFQAYLDRLHSVRRKKREPIYLLIDGLGELTNSNSGLARRLLDLLPQPTLGGFKYIVTGDAEELRSHFSAGTIVKSFPLAEFDLDETMVLLGGITSDRHLITEIHQLCSGNPGHLGSARRLIVRGTKASDLVAAMSRGASSFDVEWSMQSRTDDLVRRALATLAFHDSRSTLDGLALSAGVAVESLRQKLSNLSVIAIDSAGLVRFRANWFRIQAQKELYQLRKSVHKNMAQTLLEHSDLSERLLDVSLHYSRAEDHEQVLKLLSPDHVVELIQKAQSMNRVQNAIQLGLNAARHLERAGDQLRFGLDSAVLNEFFRFGHSISEVSALAALRQYDAAFAIARSAVLKEDRLHLLAIVAHGKVQNGDHPEPELLEHLTALATEVDPKPLGRRLSDICVHLSAVLPDVALDLAERSQTDEADRDRLFAKLSATAFEIGEERQSSLVEKMKARGHKGRIDLMQSTIAAVSGKWSANEVLMNATRLGKARDQLFVLRAWTNAGKQTDGSGRVIEHALNAAITATDYTINATVLRDLAEGLRHVREQSTLTRLLGMFGAQRGIAAKLGPSVDYVRLELLLAEAEAAIDPQACETRVLTIYYEIAQLADIQVRTQSWAWLIVGLKRIVAATGPRGLDSLISDTVRELEESFITLLDSTADHYRVTSDILSVVAAGDVENAIELSAMLNTQRRRSWALVDIAEYITSSDAPPHAACSIKTVVLAIHSPELRDAAVSAAMIGLSDNEKLSSAQLLHYDWLLGETRHIKDARMRTRTLQAAYSVMRSRQNCDSKALAQLAEDVLAAWNSISTLWLRIEDGFSIARVLARKDGDLAREYIQRSQAARKDVGGLTSPAAASAYTAVVRLSIRAVAGLVRRNLTSASDISLLALQIERVPSPGARAILWAELALKCACQEDLEMCKEIVNERVRPALTLIPDSDASYAAHVKARTAAAVFAADTAAAQVLLSELNENARDYACFLIINFLLRNCLPTDPDDYTRGSGYEVTFLHLSQVCSILDWASSDALIFQIIERVMDSLVARKNDARLKQSQKEEIVRRLSDLVSSKFPNPAFIRHNGYQIIGNVQLNRYRSQIPVEQLIAEAEKIPNTADRGYVLLEIGLFLFRSDRGKALAIVEKALTLVRANPSAVERIERLIRAADELRVYSSSLSRKLLAEANGTLRSGGVDDIGVVRRLVDVACDIEDEFARELAGALDDDEAKNVAQRQLELRALKQKIIDETSVNDSVNGALPKEYSQLGRMLLSSLQSGRMDSIRLSSAMKCVDTIAETNLSRSYMLLTWIVENAVERHARDERASMYLRPLFEGTIASGELTARLADQAFTRDRHKRNSESGAQKRENGELLTLDQLVAYLKRWIGNLEASETITIVESEFCPEDLTFIRLIRSVNLTARIIVVTRKQSQQILRDLDLRDIYSQYWNHISDQKPPNTRIAFLDTADGRSPFSETMILTQSAGIALSTNLKKFGVERLGSVRQFESSEAETIRDSIQRFTDGELEEFDGSRVEYSMWRL